MPITRRRSVATARAAFLVLAPLTLVGCGGTESGAPMPLAASDTPPTTVTRDGGTTDQTAPIAPPELASVRDRATLDQAQTAVHDDVQQTAAEVRQGAGDLREGVTRATGEAQTQAQGFAAEVRGEAQSAVNGAIGAARGQAQVAKDQIRSAARSAESKAKQQAETAGASVRQSAQDLEKGVLDGVLGPDSKSTAPNQ